jgi:hypothetical protein
VFRNKILVGLVSSALLIAPFTAHASLEKIQVSGKIVEGRTYIPLRLTAAQMKAQINWNSKTQTATVTKDGKKIVATVGKNARMFDGSVHVQLRQINDTFYGSEEISFDKSNMLTTTNHIVVNLAPLTDEQALDLMRIAVIKSNSLEGVNQKRTFLSQYFTNKAINKILMFGGIKITHPISHAAGYNSYADYTSLTSMSVVEYSEDFGEHSLYYRTELRCTIVKQGNQWLVDTIEYEHGETMYPH